MGFREDFAAVGGTIDDLAARVKKLEDAAPVPIPPVQPPAPPVIDPPPMTTPGKFAFASDFKDGLVRWAQASPDPDRIAVVDHAAFASGKACAIRYDADQQARGIRPATQWPLPPIGGSLGRRICVLFGIDGVGGSTHHPVECDSGSAAYAAEWVVERGTDPLKWLLRIWTVADGSTSYPKDSHKWLPPALVRNTLYCVQEVYNRLTATAWQLHIKISSPNLAAPYTDSDFRCEAGHGQHTLSAPGLQLTTPDPTVLQRLLIQNQGVGLEKGSANVNANRIFYGQVAITVSDKPDAWPGEYVAGEAG